MEQSKTIKGIKVRTNNNSIEDIMKIWQDFSMLGITGEVYAIYTNYESDFRGDFDLVIGTETANLEEKVIIQPGKYVVYDVEGSAPENVGATWQKIWGDTTMKRKYTTDYEVYHTDGIIQVYIAVI